MPADAKSPKKPHNRAALTEGSEHQVLRGRPKIRVSRSPLPTA
ncbi:hypothetical protein ACFV23_04685 [Streptomyces sp. NPDC059627]